MFSPISNSEVSTMFGIRGDFAMSLTNFFAPLVRLVPPLSSVALITAGLAAGKFVGASASTTLSAAKRSRRSSCQPRSASSIRPLTSRLQSR
jgi:hypothetical protein